MNRDLDERKMFGKLTILEPASIVRRYPKKRTILFQGETPKSVQIIRSGIVKVYGITSDGVQRTVTLLGAGDVFPTSWAFEKTEKAIYYYEAVSECTILATPREVFLRAVDQNSELKSQIFETYMSHYIAATMHIYALEHSHAEDKLVYILLYLATRFGVPTEEGKTRINLRLSHQDIAEMVGITRETAAVELHKLKKKGYIQYQRFIYHVDMDKLQELKGDDDLQVGI